MAKAGKITTDKRNVRTHGEANKAAISQSLKELGAGQGGFDLKAYQKSYRQSHKAELKAYYEDYRKANRDKIREKAKAYTVVNKEKNKEYKKNYYLANKEKVDKKNRDNYHQNPEVSKRYYRANRDKILIRAKDNRKQHPDRIRAYSRKRKALKRGVNHKFYTDTYIFERDGWICGICGQKINKRLKHPHPRSKSIDHIIPLSKGGADAPINLQAAHLRCNVSKNAGSGGQLRLIG